MEKYNLKTFGSNLKEGISYALSEDWKNTSKGAKALLISLPFIAQSISAPKQVYAAPIINSYEEVTELDADSHTKTAIYMNITPEKDPNGTPFAINKITIKPVDEKGNTGNALTTLEKKTVSAFGANKIKAIFDWNKAKKVRVYAEDESKVNSTSEKDITLKNEIYQKPSVTASRWIPNIQEADVTLGYDYSKSIGSTVRTDGTLAQSNSEAHGPMVSVYARPFLTTPLIDEKIKLDAIADAEFATNMPLGLNSNTDGAKDNQKYLSLATTIGAGITFSDLVKAYIQAGWNLENIKSDNFEQNASGVIGKAGVSYLFDKNGVPKGNSEVRIALKNGNLSIPAYGYNQPINQLNIDLETKIDEVFLKELGVKAIIYGFKDSNSFIAGFGAGANYNLADQVKFELNGTYAIGDGVSDSDVKAWGVNAGIVWAVDNTTRKVIDTFTNTKKAPMDVKANKDNTQKAPGKQ